ncbi:MAG: hypothetical protein QM772_18445 [Ottowia sp.]|uniref:hypothetical protein n=1 Tax=Ottowia sp. TaxID=1898956 RepID=UPI0039E49D02
MKSSFASGAAALGFWLAAVAPLPAAAWQLTPEATAVERGMAAPNRLRRAINGGAFRAMAMVGHPVHEEITRQALQCPSEGPLAPGCEFDIRYQEAGVRWNDDPAFKFLPGRGKFPDCQSGTVRMVTQPLCWAQVFLSGERSARRGVQFTGANSNLLVRSHFGDLQFLHAMAVSDGETPEQTRRNVMAWLEFTWRTSIGEAKFDSQRMVARLPVDGFAERFRHNQGWRIQDLFSLGNPAVRTEEAIQRIALGSLLHVVQDSFAAGHVEREAPVSGVVCAGRTDWPAPGQILEFHSYPHQDSRKHGRADEPHGLEAHLAGARPHVIDVVRTVAELWRARTPWDDARPYLECVFTLSPTARVSSPGNSYRSDAPGDQVQWGG